MDASPTLKMPPIPSADLEHNHYAGWGPLSRFYYSWVMKVLQYKHTSILQDYFRIRFKSPVALRA